MLRQAKRIAYTGEGTSGATFLGIIAKLGLREALAGQFTPMGAGQPVLAVIEGTADLAVAPLTTILATQGVETVAIFPADLGAGIEMSLFRSAEPTDHTAALRLVQLLTSDALDATLAAQGIERFSFPARSGP